jgi:hypothetical protein
MTLELLKLRQLRGTQIGFALVCLVLLQGCAATALSLAGLVGGTGLEHTLSGNVSRTFTAPAAGTRLAVLQALKRMGLVVERNEKQDNGWTIQAKAATRKIEINLEPLSDMTTRVSVVVSHADFTFYKDSSTSNGILEQISIDLKVFSADRHRFATAQMLLSELGYNPGEIDGVMGRKTRKAVLQFQHRNAIQADGDVTPRLIAML